MSTIFKSIMSYILCLMSYSYIPTGKQKKKLISNKNSDLNTSLLKGFSSQICSLINQD